MFIIAYCPRSVNTIMYTNSSISYTYDKTVLIPVYYLHKLLKILLNIKTERVKNMNKTTQRAVIIDNISSPYIEQAIIILKNYSPSVQSKVIAEAEKIVRDYLENIKSDDSDITLYTRNSAAPKKRKKKKSSSILKAVILYSAAAIIIGTAYKLLTTVI